MRQEAVEVEQLTVRQRAESGVVRGLAALPPRVQRRLAGRPVTIDGRTLDTEVQLMLRLMALQGDDTFETRPVPQARQAIRVEAAQFAGAPVTGLTTQEVEVDGADGPLRARLYTPDGARTPGPLLVWFHGGGWVVGDLDSHDPVCRFLATRTGFRVLAVDYRLAPEHPFPAAPQDAIAAFRWAHANAARIGALPDRIAVGGDSAGANLSAVVSLACARDGGPAPAMQVLVYPVTDLSRRRRSYELFATGYFLTTRQMDWYSDHYLRTPADAHDPWVSPLLADDLTGVAPAYVTVGGFDILRDETLEYAQRLRDAGVPTEVREHEGLIHGFVNAAGLSRSCRAAALEMADALIRGLSR